MKNILTVVKRELIGYFYSPIAYVFISVFILASFSLTFFVSKFFDANQATLTSFFDFHPWLYLIFVPAVGMRLWAEERNTGTIELLFTLPIDMFHAVLGKFLAGWIFIGTALLLTFPLPITVFYLGDPDGGVIFTGYIGSFLMAGAYLSISCITSAMTRNQVIAFIFGVLVSFVLTVMGWGFFSSILNSIFPVWISDAIASFSFINHFESIRKGILDSRDLIYFLSVIFAGLMINSCILEYKK